MSELYMRLLRPRTYKIRCV